MRLSGILKEYRLPVKLKPSKPDSFIQSYEVVSTFNMNGDLNTFGFVREGMAYRPEVRMVDACQIDWEIDGSVEIK